MGLTADSMEAMIRKYFDACNAGDREGIAACFTGDAVHYFPAGAFDGPFIGASVIADRWRNAVDLLGSVWTVDQIIADPTTARAVIEWTHFKPSASTVLRGDEWYVFDGPTGLIREIRAYYACPQPSDPGRYELGGLAYTDRGYPREPPEEVLARRATQV